MKNHSEEVTVNLEAAIAHLERAKEGGVYPEASTPYLQLGQIYMMQEKLLQARKELLQGLALDGENEEIKTLLESVELSLN